MAQTPTAANPTHPSLLPRNTAQPRRSSTTSSSRVVTEVSSSKGVTITSSKGRWEEEDRGSFPPPGLARLRTPITASTEATEEEAVSGLANLTFVLFLLSLLHLDFFFSLSRVEGLTSWLSLPTPLFLHRQQPAWTTDAAIPLSKEEIEDVLIDLANKFGFQKGAFLPLPLPASSPSRIPLELGHFPHSSFLPSLPCKTTSADTRTLWLDLRL